MEENILKDLYDYYAKDLTIHDLNKSSIIRSTYNECIINEKGLIIELQGSHDMTLFKYLEIVPKELSIPEFDRVLRTHKCIMVHSFDTIKFNHINALQKRTLRRMVKRGFLNKNALENAERGKDE